MVRGDLDQIQSWMGWLVGWLSSTPPRSRSTESVIMKEKPSENVQQACDIGLTGRVAIYTANKTEQILKKIRYGAMHKVMIGFVFPIGK